MADSRPKQLPPYGIRIPPDLKARIQASAEANSRSLHSEIIHTLEAAYPAPVEGRSIDEVKDLIFDMATFIPAERFPKAALDIDNWLARNGYPYSIRIERDKERGIKRLRLVPRRLAPRTPDDD